MVAATFVAIGLALGFSVFGEPQEGHVEIVVSAPNCRGAGSRADGDILFLLTCPQTSVSPDGRWTLVQTPAVGREEAYDVFVRANDGRMIGAIPKLNDSMPFVLRWSPRQDWFLINHYAGSGLERPRIFEVTPSGVVEHRRHLQTGIAKAHDISNCLPVDKMETTGSGVKWSRDGRRLAWVYATRPDMCVFYGDMSGPIPANKQWKPFLMISDVQTGQIVENSVRFLTDDGKWDFPTDGPYANF